MSNQFSCDLYKSPAYGPYGVFSPLVRRDERVVPESEVRVLKAKIRELERMLGKKTMETEILKEALEIARYYEAIDNVTPVINILAEIRRS